MSTDENPLESRVVRRDKVTRYLLDPASREGGGKARFFMAFGFSSDDPNALIAALHEHGGANPTTDSWDDRWGRDYEVTGRSRRPTVATRGC